MTTVQHDLSKLWVLKYADSWAKVHVEPAFNGDVDAAFKLCAALGNDKRGHVAVAMWRAKVPPDAFRAYFSTAWDHDHRYVIGAAGTRRRLAYMFRYAAFALPDRLPSVVRVWRGTSKLGLFQARTGYSWTTDRDVACWFAMRSAGSNGSPLVLRADILLSDISMWHDLRGEREAVLMKPPAVVAVDGEIEDWNNCYQRWESEKREGERAALRRAVATNKTRGGAK
ncbi:MAG: hypothetical protein WC736_16570 [Gallionella sp.]|jgi:hypothetical protein